MSQVTRTRAIHPRQIPPANLRISSRTVSPDGRRAEPYRFTGSCNRPLGPLENRDNERFLEQAYTRILDRQPDISGRVHNLALLRNRVNRQEILQRIISSEEAKQRGVRFTGMSEPATKPVRLPDGFRFFRFGWPLLLDKVRDLMRVLFHARLDVIDHKIDYVLQELASRSDSISLKTDQALWKLSEKLDSSLLHLNGLDASARERVEILGARSERVLESLANRSAEASATAITGAH